MVEQNIPSKSKPIESFDSSNDTARWLVLHNDDHNSFDFVIDTLMEICNHSFEQAEQCAIIAHFKGKCDIKRGAYDVLNPMKEELVTRGLLAIIE